MSKTQSKIGVTVTALAQEFVNIPFIQVYKNTQLFTDGVGAVKADFTGATINNFSYGVFTTSVPNDNITSTSGGFWEFSYGGFLEFESGITDQRMNIGIYKNGILIPESALQIIVADQDFKSSFSKSFIYPISNTEVYDIRFDASVGDITVKDLVFNSKFILLAI